MKRKIILQSRRAHTITLPIKWVRKSNLKEGDEVELTEQASNLVIHSNNKQAFREIDLDLPKARESSTRTQIINAYRAGFDKIIVKYPGPRSIIKNIVNEFMIGFELFEKPKHYILRSVSEPSYDNFDNMVHIILYTLKQIFENFEDYNILPDVHKVQRYDNFLKRLMAKKEKNPALYQFLSNLTQIARLALHAKKDIKKLDPNSKKIIERITHMIDLLKKAYQKKDPSLLSKVHEVDDELTILGKKNFKKYPQNTHHLLQIARTTYLANSPLNGYLQLLNFK